MTTNNIMCGTQVCSISSKTPTTITPQTETTLRGTMINFAQIYAEETIRTIMREVGSATETIHIRLK